jgi:pyruvate formate lyase activating enzyme
MRLKEALFYRKLKENKVCCFLCHQFCTIGEGKRGFCGVRENRRGVLYSLVYGKPVAQHIDPIEKKPLYHFYPGSSSFSIATVGCNFRCLHCQNADISQPDKSEVDLGGYVAPEQVVKLALKSGVDSISYTYTEPTIFFEYALDIAKLAKKEGLKNIFVTNGYMSEEALKAMEGNIDAANVDLKSFSDEFYKKICSASVKPVLENLKLMKKYGIWIEVTTLIIPSLNDSQENLAKIADFIYEELGKDVPWHISAFYPTHKLTDLPPTAIELLYRGIDIGYKNGLHYVYTGNVPGDSHENTYCFNCRRLLIERCGYKIVKNTTRDNKCPHCGTELAGFLSKSV